jgi:hypothetical protein
MLTRIRNRLTYANVTMTLALIFAMTGGAYAASKILITSTKQIKPSVLKQLQGKAGPVGTQGTAGPTGPQGPAGKDGVNGKDGASGTSGANGESVASAALSAGKEGCSEGGSKFTVGGKTTTACNGEKGEPGPAGPPGTTGFTRKLPSGETETGTWSLFQAETPSGFHWVVPISFSIPLKAGISFTNVHVVKNCAVLGGTLKTECEKEVKETEKFCPGTVEDPKAVSGDLCFFQGNTLLPKTETEEGQFTAMQTILPGGSSFGETGASPAGTALLVGYEGPANERVLSVGTWAVTAP